MTRMKPQVHLFQLAEPAEYSKFCQKLRYTQWKAPRVRFCHPLPRDLDD